MAFTDDQYNRLLARVTKLENLANDMLVAMNRFVTTTQVQQLLTITQADIQELSSTVEALESRLENLEEEPNS